MIEIVTPRAEQESVHHWRCCCQCQLSTWQFKNLIAIAHTTLPNDIESMSNKTLSLSLSLSLCLCLSLLCLASPPPPPHLSLSLSLSLSHTYTQVHKTSTFGKFSNTPTPKHKNHLNPPLFKTPPFLLH